MTPTKKIGMLIVMLVLFGVALYSIVYFMASHSDAFKFVEQKVKNSEVIKAQVGLVKNVRPSLLGSFDQKTVGSDEWASMKVNVAGELRTMEIEVKAKKANNNWTLESVRSGERNFDLK